MRAMPLTAVAERASIFTSGIVRTIWTMSKVAFFGLLRALPVVPGGSG